MEEKLLLGDINMGLQNLFKSQPSFKTIDPYKILYNVGSLLDIPTGSYIRGEKGENILNGGLSIMTSVAGKPNTYKTTIADYIIASALNKIIDSGYHTIVNTYDTEGNKHPDRVRNFCKRFDRLKDIDVFDENIWTITDPTVSRGEEWFKDLRDFLRDNKIKNMKQYMIKTPLIDREGKNIYTVLPTLGCLDSLTKFKTSAADEISDKNDLGESGNNRLNLKMGLDKANLISQLPSMLNAAGHYMVMTAHVGKETEMNQGPVQIPNRTMQFQKLGEKYKGVPGDFLYLSTVLIEVTKATLENNQGTKGPEFPKTRDQIDEGSTDLNRITLKIVRSKSGPSGTTIDIIVSQSEGVLPTLSEFVHIKDNGRYGLSGNNTSYTLDLYPTETIMRTTIRSIIDSNPDFCRAVKITSEMLQIKKYFKDLPFSVPEPKDLYEKLDKEYGFLNLLRTRDYFTFNQYEHPVPYLSTMDMLEMYHGLYKPYWMK